MNSLFKIVLLLVLVACGNDEYKEPLPEDADHDWDGDGYTEDDGDCNDVDPFVYPQATEVCDGIDNDCDQLIDEEDGSIESCD